VTKAELVGEVAKKVGLSQVQAREAVDAVLDAVTATLKKGQKVQVIGFGTFEVRRRKARTAVNPQTREKVQVPATRVPAFRPGAELKAAVKR
jgi:DNA-binding protein HU-beta